MKCAVIDIQSGKVFLYLIEAKNKSWEFKQKLELKNISELGGSIQDQGLKDIGRWLVSLPLADLGFRILKFPFGDKAKISRVLPLELGNILLLKPEEIVYDFRVKKTGTNDFEVELIFIEKAGLVKILQALKDNGVTLSAVTSLEFILGNYLGGEEPSLDERVSAAKTACADPVVNLMSREFLEANIKPEIKQKILLGYWLAVTFLVLTCASLLFEIRDLKNKNSVYQEMVSKAYTALFPGSTVANGYYQLQAKLKEVKDKDNFMPHAGGLKFLRFISGSDLGGLRIDNFKLDEKSLEVKGDCRALSEAEGFKNKIEGYFERPASLESRKSPDGQFLFSIKTEYKK